MLNAHALQKCDPHGSTVNMPMTRLTCPIPTVPAIANDSAPHNTNDNL